MKERKIVFFSLILQNFGTVYVVELYNIKKTLSGHLLNTNEIKQAIKITCIGSSIKIDYI